jgi:hypothetical protein
MTLAEVEQQLTMTLAEVEQQLTMTLAEVDLAQGRELQLLQLP